MTRRRMVDPAPVVGSPAITFLPPCGSSVKEASQGQQDNGHISLADSAE